MIQAVPLILALFTVDPTSIFYETAVRYAVDPIILEGICRYESGHGRFLLHHNRNGTWDVGYCQNHRYSTGDSPPPVPKKRASIKEAAKELKYWEKQHQRFCVDLYLSTGRCGYQGKLKWRGVKNCHRPHRWFSHYNWGFRVLYNNYGHKVQCFINKGYKKCSEEEWEQEKDSFLKR